MRGILGLVLLVLGLPALALVTRHGGTVIIPAGQTITDDLVVAGGTIRVEGRVTGDVVAAGGTIEIAGPVGGNLIAAGGTITVDEPVGGSAYVTGGTIALNAPIGRNLAIGGGTVQMAAAARVGRDLAAGAGDLTVRGTIARDLLVGAGILRLTESARVGGNLRAVTNDPKIAAGAVIVGERQIRQAEHEQRDRRPSAIWWFVWPLLSGLALLLVGVPFIAMAPRVTEATQPLLRAHPWGSLLTGLVGLFILPPLALMLMVTVLGIPLALILLAAYGALLFLSPIFPAIWLGRLAWRRPAGSLYVALLIGLGLLTLIRLVPLLGGLVLFLAIVLGLGALTLVLFARAGRPLVGPPPPAPTEPPAAAA
jgi:hypothetical protein